MLFLPGLMDCTARTCRVSSEGQQSESTELQVGSAAAGDPLTADGHYEQFKAATLPLLPVIVTTMQLPAEVHVAFPR
jgi:hypothetical protein